MYALESISPMMNALDLTQAYQWYRTGGTFWEDFLWDLELVWVMDAQLAMES